MIRVVYSEACLADFRNILDYLNQHTTEYAGRLLNEIMDTCELIATQPRMGTARENIAPGLRLLTHRPYAIFYRYNEEENVIRIQRVLHHSRDIGSQAFDEGPS